MLNWYAIRNPGMNHRDRSEHMHRKDILSFRHDRAQRAMGDWGFGALPPLYIGTKMPYQMWMNIPN